MIYLFSTNIHFKASKAALTALWKGCLCSAKFSCQESRVLGSMMALSQTRGMTSEKASWPFFNVCHICAIKPLTQKLMCFSPRWGPTSHSQTLTLYVRHNTASLTFLVSQLIGFTCGTSEDEQGKTQ